MPTKLIEFKPEALVIPAKELSFDGIRIRPGINYQLTQTQVEALLGHPDFPRYIGKGIEVKEAELSNAEEIDPTANADKDDLSAFRLDQIDDIVRATYDIAILKKWLSTERRVKARREIENRITAISEGRG
jgi:hypothetical protein